MSRDWELYLRDMVECARKIVRFSAERSFDDFAADEMAYDAVVRNLEVLGEAAKGIPQDVRLRHPEVDWRSIAGLRDVLAHAYFALDDATLWRIVHTDVPVVLGHLEQIERDAG